MSIFRIVLATSVALFLAGLAACTPPKVATPGAATELVTDGVAPPPLAEWEHSLARRTFRLQPLQLSPEKLAEEAERSTCASTGPCPTVPRPQADWVVRWPGPYTVNANGGSGWLHLPEIAIPDDGRPDCEREIEAVAILIDTGGLTYRAAACLPNSHECMDVFRWYLVETWESFDRGCNECVTTAGECDGCEMRVWRGSSEKGGIAMSSLCAGRASISIYVGRESEFTLQDIWFLVWYKR